MKTQNKTVLITGASSGIGFELARQLAGRNCSLILIARNTQKLSAAVEQITKEFPDSPAPETLICDISSEESVNLMIEHCEKQYAKIDILINNAGSGLYGSASKSSLLSITKIINTNFLGTVNVTLKTLPLLEKSKCGLIVNISSAAALYGVPYLTAYSASKAAMAVFGQGLRAELSSSGISVVNVYPGYTNTDFFNNEISAGDARRPSYKYKSPDNIASKIIKSIEKNKREVLITEETKILNFVKKYIPVIIDPLMNRIAFQLKF